VTRVYLPLNRAALGAALQTGEIGPPPWTAYAVTPELRAAHGAGLDVEELEYAAYERAVGASRAMLDPGRSDDRRRLVAAADVGAVQPRPSGDPGEVSVLEPVPWSAVVSVHADVDDLGTIDDDPELAWFATQEASELLR
jgi:hypothetical protein